MSRKNQNGNLKNSRNKKISENKTSLNKTDA